MRRGPGGDTRILGVGVVRGAVLDGQGLVVAMRDEVVFAAAATRESAMAEFAEVLKVGAGA